VAVEVGLEGVEGFSQGEAVEDVGEPVVVEVQGAEGLAEAGLDSEGVLLCPGLEFVEAVVGLGGEEDEPDTDDLAEGEVAFPEVVGREMAVEQLRHPQALQIGKQDRDVVHPLPLITTGFVVSMPSDLAAFPLSEKCLSP